MFDLQAASRAAFGEEEGDMALGMFEDVSGDESSAWPDLPAQKPKAAPLVGPWGSSTSKGKASTSSSSKKKGANLIPEIQGGEWRTLRACKLSAVGLLVGVQSDVIKPP